MAQDRRNFMNIYAIKKVSVAGMNWNFLYVDIQSIGMEIRPMLYKNLCSLLLAEQNTRS